MRDDIDVRALRNELSEQRQLRARDVAEKDAEIERLQKVVEDQALTIGVLKDECARLNKENDDWHKASRVLRETVDVARKALQWFLERDHFVKTVKALYGANIVDEALLRAIDDLIEWEKATPKPGAAT